MAFIYPKDDTSYIVKGGYIDVTKFLEHIETKPAIVHYTFFNRGFTRRIVESINCGKVTISIICSLSGGWEVSVARPGISPYEVIATMKKLPRKWIKELNTYVDDQKNMVPEKKFKGWRKIIL
jgi:hypothetical protein